MVLPVMNRSWLVISLVAVHLACGEGPRMAAPAGWAGHDSAANAGSGSLVTSGAGAGEGARGAAGTGAPPIVAGASGAASTDAPAGRAGAAGSADPVAAGTGGAAGTEGTAGVEGTAGAGGMPGTADCEALVSDPAINWRESALQTDQEIVACLAASLGRPVGYGEAARGGHDPAGGSKLTIITRSTGVSVERQIADAVAGDEHNWIVFDKRDFAEPYEIGLYRLQCGEARVQAALGISSPERCIDYRAWCTANGVASGRCLETFFNGRLNDGSLPIRNPRIGSNKTLDGRHSRAYFVFSGFAIGSDSGGQPVNTERNVILTNLLFQGAGHTEDHALDPDMIRSTGASRDIWIHQNTFDLTGDSAFDVKVGAHNITMSFNLVKDVKRAALHSSSDNHTIDQQIATTMHHNAFVTSGALYTTFGNTGRRVPLIRRGKSHMWNNVFYNYRKDVLSVRVGARVAFEDNMFLADSAVAGSDNLAYFVANLLRDFQDGGLRITGSYVFMSDASCNVSSATRGDLSASHGSTPNLLTDYGQSSRSAITEHRLPAGAQLAAYVLATAGKGGAAPFNSPYTMGRRAIATMPRRACP
jgi:pectate lyase